MAIGFEKADRASRCRSCRRRPAKCSRRSRPSAPIRRATSGGRAPATLTCRRPRKDCSRRTGRRTSAQLYDWARAISRVVAIPCRRRVRRHPRARLQHRDRRAKRSCRCPNAGRTSTNPVYKGEVMLRQSQFVGHRLPDARDAGAGVRRGRGVPLHEGAQRQRQSVRALGHRPDDGGDARRKRRSAAPCCTA